MSESTITATDAGTENTEPQGEGTTAKESENQPAGGSRTFTQEQVNSLLAKERRETEARFAGYDELKAKAAKLDEIEEASKTEFEKVSDALRKAIEERNAAIAERDAKQAEIDRAAAVAKAAEEHGVDAALLARMAGDVEDNAAFLAAQEASRPKYPDIKDDGESGPHPMTEEEIDAIKSPAERLRARAEWIQNQQKG